MSEHRHPCPHCDRPVGGHHTATCPRGQFQQQRLAQVCAALLRPRVRWLSAILMTERQMQQATEPLRGVKRTNFVTHEGARLVPLFKVPYQGQYVRPKLEQA